MTDFLHSVQHQTSQITFTHLENRYNILERIDFFWNELTILWNDLPIDWNDLSMERNDRKVVT